MSDASYDAVLIGGGHNGLTTANYLALGGMRVCVLEQREVVGGAAVSEEATLDIEASQPAEILLFDLQ